MLNNAQYNSEYYVVYHNNINLATIHIFEDKYGRRHYIIIILNSTFDSYHFMDNDKTLALLKELFGDKVMLRSITPK